MIEDGELVLADSNAILVYLAARYDASGQWLPRDPARAARAALARSPPGSSRPALPRRGS